MSSEDRLADFCAASGHFYSRCNGTVRSFHKSNGLAVGSADCPEDPVLTARLDSDREVLYTAHKSKLIRAWNGADLQPSLEMPPLKTDHKGPIVLIVAKGSRLITASAEAIIKVWHLQNRYCSGVLRQCSALPVCLEYEEFSDSEKYAFCGTNSGSVHLWNADTNQVVATGTKHFSPVSAIKAVPTIKSIVSSGRDKTLIFWSLSLEPTKVIPVFEEIETMSFVTASLTSRLSGKDCQGQSEGFLLTAGEKGRLRLWDLKKQSELLPTNEKKDFAITTKGVIMPDTKVSDVFVQEEDSTLVVVQDDLLSLCTITGKKNKIERRILCTNQYEALEMIILDERFLVVATTSSVIKVDKTFEAITLKFTIVMFFLFQLYDLLNDNKLMVASGGHEDSVLSVASASDKTFVSCGKDHSVCLWTLTSKDKIKLIGKGRGHSSFVGAVTASDSHIFSASKDGILKVWKKPGQDVEELDEVAELQTVRTILAHDQEINSVASSPNGDLVASASQDKTCKIWRTEDMGLLTTLTGHRRGIWRVVFTDDSVWTASADCTLKRWSLKSMACLNTLEGHLSSVLSMNFITSHKMASVSSDGLLKIWDTKTANAIGTFDAHDDKIWSVMYSEQTKELVTAGRDGNLFFWADKTEEVKALERKKAEEAMKHEQTLSNYLQSGKLTKALKLALRLDRPRQSKKILFKLYEANQLEEAVMKLDIDLRNQVLKYVIQWNAVGGASCELAQAVLKVFFTEYFKNGQKNEGYKINPDQIAGLMAYTEKHYKRIDKLESRAAVADLLLSNM